MQRAFAGRDVNRAAGEAGVWRGEDRADPGLPLEADDRQVRTSRTHAASPAGVTRSKWWRLERAALDALVPVQTASTAFNTAAPARRTFVAS